VAAGHHHVFCSETAIRFIRIHSARLSARARHQDGVKDAKVTQVVRCSARTENRDRKSHSLSGETSIHRFVPQGRSLLMSASLGTLDDVEMLVERLLTCIEPVEVSHNESWGGKSFELSRRDTGSRQLSIALLHILSHRWLPTLRCASLALRCDRN
jgi:hypothetical protein